MQAGKKYPKTYIANQHMLCENRLPARTLLLPAQTRGVTHKNFTDSDRVQLLSGDWKFCYLREDTDAPFYLTAKNDDGWDTLPIPSMWQFHGYGTCYYPNVRYCFPYDPPYIHRSNPVGLFRKTFSASCAGRRAILRFLGVDNACFVWLNGQYIGFSKGSRIPAEFDVTGVLRDGENLLAVKVYTFSDASYLENQDMLLASGIFRDVMLIYTGETALWDELILPDPAGFTVRYQCRTDGTSPAAIRFTLCDAAGAVCAEREQPVAESGEVFLPLTNAVTWNAEQPYLYTLYTEILENGAVTETHTKKAGIAKSEIKDCRLLMNGKPITLKGINRHENNAHTGRAITAGQIEAELRDIKSCNLNAIRCSHYTNHPLFYELCSELGIYVMDEADCETHGAECTGDLGALNKDPDWYDAFFDRTARMYAINKNETCINIWSLGNECGHGENNDRCVAWLQAQAVKKPIKDNNNSMGDPDGGYFATTGYMPMQTLYDMGAEGKHPLMMLEYAHAMGNSPGGLEDIWNWVYENEQCCGGYVWEFKSHGFYIAGKNGKPRYLYGGDFPDRYHWSNFSLDGYHTSDGTPKPSWAELREVSAPVFVKWAETGVTVKNTYDFLPLDGVTMQWSVCVNGAAVRKGEVSLDGLPARQSRFVALPLETNGLVGLVTADCAFIKNGRRIALKQTILADVPAELPEAVGFEHKITQTDDAVHVAGPDFSVSIQSGLLSRLVKNGAIILDAPMRLNCMRAPTDNDGIVGFSPRLIDEWNGHLVDSMRFGCHGMQVEDAPDAVTVTATGKFLPHSHFWGFDTTIRYRIFAGGETEVSVRMQPYGNNLPSVLPRVGAVFKLDGSYARIRWLGRGLDENYPDCKAHTPIGRYEADIADMYFRYDVPQETGNHCDCRSAAVFAPGKSLTVNGIFSFSCHTFPLDSLIRARHADELEPGEARYLYIDHKHRGLGSNSCGPQPEEPYELRPGTFDWSFRLKADA
ncbi:MAG: hypothetical protein IKW76_01560 [Clostridia bacterium]|nr:hypothetical protein [Clostridia bacterium]